MKCMKKFARISALSTVVGMLVGANLAVFSMARHPEPIIPVKNSFVATQVEPVAPESSPVVVEQPADVQPVTQSVPVSEPAPTPVYRSFDEIILDFPNMSQGYHAVECSHVIEAAYPDRFTPEKRETNIRLIATHFINSCAAAYKGSTGSADVSDGRPLIYLRDFDGTGDFWQKNGGL